MPIYPEISNQIQIMMGEVLSGAKEPEEALDDAWERVIDAYTRADAAAGAATAPPRTSLSRGRSHDAGRSRRAGTAARRPAGRRARRRLSEQPLVWLLPLALLLLVSYVYPGARRRPLQLHRRDAAQPGLRVYAGELRNVTGNPDLPGILWVTFIFVVASVVLQLVLGLLVAMALNRGVQRGLPGVSFIRIVILCSWIVPGVAGGIVWQLMFNEASYGFLNGVLRMSASPPVAWLSDPDIAIWSAVIANVWRGTAFSMILLYAGLLVIPASLYEAAAVDGATAFGSSGT